MESRKQQDIIQVYMKLLQMDGIEQHTLTKHVEGVNLSAEHIRSNYPKSKSKTKSQLVTKGNVKDILFEGLANTLELSRHPNSRLVSIRNGATYIFWLGPTYIKKPNVSADVTNCLKFWHSNGKSYFVFEREPTLGFVDNVSIMDMLTSKSFHPGELLSLPFRGSFSLESLQVVERLRDTKTKYVQVENRLPNLHFTFSGRREVQYQMCRTPWRSEQQAKEPLVIPFSLGCPVCLKRGLLITISLTEKGQIMTDGESYCSHCVSVLEYISDNTKVTW